MLYQGERERGGGGEGQKGERERQRGERQRDRDRQKTETDKEHTSCIFTQLMNMYRPQDYNSTYPSCTYAGFLEIRERERSINNLANLKHDLYQ